MTQDYAVHRVGNAEVIRLPTSDPTIGFLVVLPDADDGLPALLASLDAPTLEAIVAPGSLEPLDLQMPLLSLSSRLDLAAILPELGLPSFASGVQFGSLCPTCVQLGSAQQETVVSVGYDGLEAAAASYGTFADTAGYKPRYVYVDHPFLFVILDEAAGVPWFLGTVVDPT